jgi:hypothetical protein
MVVVMIIVRMPILMVVTAMVFVGVLLAHATIAATVRLLRGLSWLMVIVMVRRR